MHVQQCCRLNIQRAALRHMHMAYAQRPEGAANFLQELTSTDCLLSMLSH
jgi:hypothetical protein